jgi:hypothetical protein
MNAEENLSLDFKGLNTSAFVDSVSRVGLCLITLFLRMLYPLQTFYSIYLNEQIVTNYK